jgi:hypothetical protein
VLGTWLTHKQIADPVPPVLLPEGFQDRDHENT